MGWDNNFDSSELCGCGYIKSQCPNGSECDRYYQEGDECPNCGGGLVVRPCMDTGEGFLMCETCNHNATEEEK